MNTLSYKTVSANKATAKKEWIVIDAENEIVGRLCSAIAKTIRGKHKTNYTPHVDCGDNVIVINAEKVKFSGNKMTEKVYVRHTGFPGGQRFVTPKQLMAKHPIRVVQMAVKGMLPKTKLGDALFGNLHVYAGATHPHEAQKPKTVKLSDIK